MKTDIHEYCEEMEVEIKQLIPEEGEKYKNIINERSYQGHIESRWIVRAYNEGGFNSTEVDLVDLLTYIKINMPDLWNSV